MLNVFQVETKTSEHSSRHSSIFNINFEDETYYPKVLLLNLNLSKTCWDELENNINPNFFVNCLNWLFFFLDGTILNRKKEFSHSPAIIIIWLRPQFLPLPTQGFFDNFHYRISTNFRLVILTSLLQKQTEEKNILRFPSIKQRQIWVGL